MDGRTRQHLIVAVVARAQGGHLVLPAPGGHLGRPRLVVLGSKSLVEVNQANISLILLDLSVP